MRKKMSTAIQTIRSKQYCVRGAWIARCGNLGHLDRMARATSLLRLAPIALALAGCGQRADDAEDAVNSTDAVTSDPVRNTTTEAMCGKPRDQAHAIGRIAEGPKDEADPDYVYEVAAEIAEKGCPKPNG